MEASTPVIHITSAEFLIDMDTAERLMGEVVPNRKGIHHEGKEYYRGALSHNGAKDPIIHIAVCGGPDDERQRDWVVTVFRDRVPDQTLYDTIFKHVRESTASFLNNFPPIIDEEAA